MLVGLPDLGGTPMAAEFESEEGLTYLTNHHNAMLEALTQELQVLHPETRFHYFDVNEMFLAALNEPANYGFTDVTGTCYETLEYMPSSQSILNMASRIKARPLPVDACDTYLFFDPVHPSGRAHAYIGKEAVDFIDEAGIELGDG